MCRIIREYYGNGTFICNSEKYNSDFLLFQYSDGTIVIEWEQNDFINIEPGSIISMKGIDSRTGSKINVSKAHVQRVKKGPGTKITMKSFEPVEIIYEEIECKTLKIRSGLTNFVFRECELTSSDSYGFNVNIDDFEVSLIHLEDYEEKLKKLENKEEKVLVTSEIEICFNEADFHKIEQIINDISYLLSYASRNVVSPIYNDYYSEDDLIKTVLKPLLTRDYNNRDMLIDSDHLGECNIKDFLETTYPAFVAYKSKFGLNIVISFYIEAVTFAYCDMGFLLSATALETLLSGYEEMRILESNPIDIGLIKKNTKTIKTIFEDEGHELDEIAEKIANAVSYPNLNVQEKLSAFIKDPRFLLKLNSYDRDFSIIRNKIAHNGKFPNLISSGKERKIDCVEEHNRLIYLTDRIILTILGYKGKTFLNRGNNYESEFL